MIIQTEQVRQILTGNWFQYKTTKKYEGYVLTFKGDSYLEALYRCWSVATPPLLKLILGKY